VMKRILSISVFLLASNAIAAPFVVGEVVSGVVECGVFLDAEPKVVVPAVNGECRYDVGHIAVGNHRVEMTAIGDATWGGAESAKSVPLDFVRPGNPPVNLRLVP